VLDLAKTEQVVVCHDKLRAVGARFCQPERSGARFGHDKMKAVGLDLAKAGDRRWSAVTKRRRWGSIWQKMG